MSYLVKLPTEYGDIWVNPDHVVMVTRGDSELPDPETYSYLTLPGQLRRIELPITELLERLAISNGEMTHLNVQLGRDPFEGHR